MRAKDRGDLHVELQVETPVNLTAKQRKLLEEFSKDCCEEAHPQTQGFFDSVKKFFRKRQRRPDAVRRPLARGRASVHDSAMTLSIAIAGAAGRMGRALIRAASADPRFTIAGGTERREGQFHRR